MLGKPVVSSKDNIDLIEVGIATVSFKGHSESYAVVRCEIQVPGHAHECVFAVIRVLDSLIDPGQIHRSISIRRCDAEQTHRNLQT